MPNFLSITETQTDELFEDHWFTGDHANDMKNLPQLQHLESINSYLT